MSKAGIAKLINFVSLAPHDLRSTTQIFVDLNVDRIKDDMDLSEMGRSRGKTDRPPSTSQSLDELEHQIVERVEAHKRASYDTFIDQRHIYAERLAALDFEGRFATIRQAAPEAVSEFKAEAGLGRDELVTLRRRLIESEQEREHFRSAHRLKRAARLRTRGKSVLTIGVLACLFVLEVVFNGFFLAKGNTQGILGGVVQALTFAALNILVSFFAGLVAIRQLNHLSIFWKFLGVVSLLTYLAFAFGLNLALSHYREVSGSLSLEAGQAVLSQLKTNPWGLNDVDSWLFFGFGFCFSLFAMADGLIFLDPYPGYGAVEQRCANAHAAYTDQKSTLIDNLRHIRDEAADAMNASAKDLGDRRGEYDSILTGDSRLKSSFKVHQDQIERAANALLAAYREANIQSRKSEPPQHFARPFTLTRLTDHDDLANDTARSDLRERIIKSQALLEEQIQAIRTAFDTAVESYREIDALLPENLGVHTNKAL